MEWMKWKTSGIDALQQPPSPIAHRSPSELWPGPSPWPFAIPRCPAGSSRRPRPRFGRVPTARPPGSPLPTREIALALAHRNWPGPSPRPLRNIGPRPRAGFGGALAQDLAGSQSPAAPAFPVPSRESLWRFSESLPPSHFQLLILTATSARTPDRRIRRWPTSIDRRDSPKFSHSSHRMRIRAVGAERRAQLAEFA